MSTERTPLTSSVVEQQRATYTPCCGDAYRFHRQCRRELHLQYLLSLIVVVIFIMALVASISYSVREAAIPAAVNDTLNETASNVLRLGLSPDDNSNNDTGLTIDEWQEALLTGQKAIDDRETADAAAVPVINPSPESRHRFAVHTSVFAGRIALGGVAEVAATKALNRARRSKGKPMPMDAHFDGSWVPQGICKEFGKFNCPEKGVKYRTLDGTCNHEKQSGSSMMPFRRVLPPDYADGISEPRKGKLGNELPSARQVSLQVHPPAPSYNPQFTVMLAVFGQFLDHDITATAISQGANGSSLLCCPPTHPECFPVQVGPGDPYYDTTKKTCMDFVRSAPAPQCKLGPRQQLNQVTSFIDASVIYGTNAHAAQALRAGEGGRMRMQITPDNRELLPASLDPSDGCNREQEKARGRYCFVSGDARANENLHLTTMHLLWARQHNRVARELQKLNPYWDDEKLFQESRKIIGAKLQHVTYNEFLPIVLGESVVATKNLRPLRIKYRKLAKKMEPAIANHFAAAAFRFAHTLLPGLMRVTDAQKGTSSYIELHRMLFNPYSLYDDGGVTDSIKIATSNVIQRTTTHVTAQLTRHLFEDAKANHSVPCGLDLVSLNIQRGRDHGLPSYVNWREHCGLSRPKTFEDLSEDLDPATLQAISELYDYVEDIDLYTGALAEIPKSDGLLGPTFTCLIANQFERLQNGDKFWYETNDEDRGFTAEQLSEIRKTSLARLICDVSDGIKEIQSEVMRSESVTNPTVSCEDIPSTSLVPWKDTNMNATYLNWMKLKREISESVNGILMYIESNKPLPNNEDWQEFTSFVNQSFAELKSEIANMRTNVTETSVRPALKLSGDDSFILRASDNFTDDWANFKGQIVQVINDLVQRNNNNSNVDWVTFGNAAKNQFAELSDDIAAFKTNGDVNKDTSSAPLEQRFKRATVVSKDPPQDGDAKMVLTPEELFNLTADWKEFKSNINKTIAEAFDKTRQDNPDQTASTWASWKNSVVEEFKKLKDDLIKWKKSNATDQSKVPEILTPEEVVPEIDVDAGNNSSVINNEDWVNLKSEVNATVAKLLDTVNSVNSVDFSELKASMKKAFDDLKSEIDSINSSSDTLHSFRIVTITIYATFIAKAII